MSELALKLVRKCLETKDPYLDLGNCGLGDEDFTEGTPLDIELRKCIHLRTLILSNSWWDGDQKYSSNSGNKNLLNSLPACLSWLIKLIELICCGYENKWGIGDITAIYPLVTIQKLDLSRNQISELKGLENLIALQNLDISSNQISELKGLENLTTLKNLDISRNQISELKGFENLTALQDLNISHNKISELKGFENLSALKNLYIYANQISELKGLENLAALQNLYVSYNQISELKGLENLTALQDLDISHNQISELKGLENSTALQNLDISYNKISELKGLENLTALQNLDISSNQISELKGLENLTALQNFDISSNQISELKGCENLDAVRTLDISGNNISDLQALIPFINKKDDPFNVVFKDYLSSSESYKINAKDNPLRSPPIEIAQQGNEAILNYFAELDKQGIDYLYEAKMLIVGQPRAGKTSLRYKLADVSAPLPEEDKTTRGIDIKKLNFGFIDNDGSQREFFYNVWDFGGQQIYQTTHQFFLTHRSLYMLVMDTGKDSIGNDDNTMNYWLQALELLGGKSPLLLVLNEKGDRKINIDIPQKRARFDFLKTDYGLNLNALIENTPTFEPAQLQKFQALKRDIQNELSGLPLVGFPMPKNWVQVRNELQEQSLEKHFITTKEFTDICQKYEVTDYDRQMELGRIFHDLGIFLHFQGVPALEDFIILQNTWATDAVFAVLDNEDVQKNKGRFSFDDLAKIWGHKTYEPAAHGKLLQLMMQFELCYQIEKSSPGVYIIPEMLADTSPAGCTWQPDNDLPLRYRYDFMPKGILTRLIVRMHRSILIYEGEQAVWKTGVKVDGDKLHCPNTEAEIIEAWDNKQLDIKAHGPFAKDLLTRISQEIDQLNHEYFRHVSQDEAVQKSRWYKMVPCNCITCRATEQKHFYKYDDLIKRKAFGKDTIECEKEPFEAVSITQLLDGVFAKAKEKNESKKESQVITIFLASSSELKDEREQFEIFIGRENKQLNEKGIFLKLEMWEDFLDTVSQTRLQDEYNEAIHKSDIFVMLYFRKVGKYTAEEFEKAFKHFKESDKPKIYTYFKRSSIDNANIDRGDMASLWSFQDKLEELGHFHTQFENNAALHLHFKNQLKKLYDL